MSDLGPIFPGMPLKSLLQCQGQLKKNDGGPEADKKTVAHVCQECEAVFLSQLMKQLRHSMLSGEIAPRHSGTDDYWELFDHAVARYLAQSGGVGLGRLLSEQLLKDSVHSPSLTQGERQP